MNGKRLLEGSQTLACLHEKAREAGMECLDAEWKGREARYRLRCRKGHEFTRLRSNILFAPPTCLECAKDERLAKIRRYAESKGGKCLESSYLHNVKYRFVCAHGHEWAVDVSRMMNKGSWCPHCVNIARAKRQFDSNGLAKLQSVAQSRGGRCLSDIYLGTAKKHKFECAQGHTWRTTAADIHLGRWCRICAVAEASERRRLHDGLERLQKVAKAKGGQCVSTEYTSSQLRYRFRCARGHEWDMDFHRAMHGSWCMECRHEDRRERTLKELQRIAHERGGKCLSIMFIAVNLKLQWECHRGHQWSAISTNVRRGHWCPTCSKMSLISNPKTKAKWKYLRAGSSLDAR
jgi:hypothetical protein